MFLFQPDNLRQIFPVTRHNNILLRPDLAGNSTSKNLDIVYAYSATGRYQDEY